MSKDIINKVSQFDESKQNLAQDMSDVVKELERRSNENKNTKYSVDICDDINILQENPNVYQNLTSHLF